MLRHTYGGSDRPCGNAHEHGLMGAHGFGLSPAQVAAIKAKTGGVALRGTGPGGLPVSQVKSKRGPARFHSPQGIQHFSTEGGGHDPRGRFSGASKLNKQARSQVASKLPKKPPLPAAGKSPASPHAGSAAHSGGVHVGHSPMAVLGHLGHVVGHVAQHSSMAGAKMKHIVGETYHLGKEAAVAGSGTEQVTRSLGGAMSGGHRGGGGRARI